MIRRIAKTLGFLAGVGVAGVAAGLLEARCPVVRRFDVPVLAQGQQPVRVLHVSDLHLRPSQQSLIAFVRALAGLEADVVVSTGDNMASPHSVDAVIEAYEPLFEKPGVFVFGSNDYYGPSLKNPLSYFFGRESSRPKTMLPAEALASALERHGWSSLNNARAILEVGGHLVEFRGTNDAHMKADDYSSVSGPASDGVDVSIGVTHAPYLRLLDEMTDDGVSLILAGHTHGGQVCLPFKGALVTNCDLDTGRAKGLHPHRTTRGSSWLHVSAGLGTSPYAPYRLFCRPEVSLLTLVPAA